MKPTTTGVLVLVWSLTTLGSYTSSNYVLPTAFTFRVPSTRCPFGFQEALGRRLNEMRQAENLRQLDWSPDIDEAAFNYALILWKNFTGPKIYKGYYVRQFGKRESRPVSSMTIKLTKILNSMVIGYDATFTREVWKGARTVGFACLVPENPMDGRTGARVYLTLLLKVKLPKPAPKPMMRMLEVKSQTTKKPTTKLVTTTQKLTTKAKTKLTTNKAKQSTTARPKTTTSKNNPFTLRKGMSG